MKLFDVAQSAQINGNGQATTTSQSKFKGFEI